MIHPDPQDELRVLGFAGASQLASSRANYHAQLHRIAAQKIQKATQQKAVAQKRQDFLDQNAKLQHQIAEAAQADDRPKLTQLRQQLLQLQQEGAAADALPPTHPWLGGWVERGFDLAGVGLVKDIYGNAVEFYRHPIQHTKDVFEASTPAERAEGKRWWNLYREGKVSQGEMLKHQPMAIGIVPWGLTKGASRGAAEFLKEARKPSRIPTRIYRAGDMEVAIPAAGSRFGRAMEGFADAVRRWGKVPGLKTEAKKALEEEGMRRAKYGNRVPEARIRRLQQIDKHLTDEQHYAIRLSLEGSSPADAIAHHRALARDVAIPEDQRVYHAIHASLIQEAEKYLTISPEGKVDLIADLPHGKGMAVGRRLAKDEAAMKEARDLIIEVAKGREDRYRDIFALTDEQIANRIAGPARVRKGARWRANEEQLQEDLANSPLRVEMEQYARELAATQIPGDSAAILERQRIAANAIMQLSDAAFRSRAQEFFGSPKEFAQLQEMVRFSREPIPEDALTQGAVISFKGYYRELVSGPNADRILAELPETGISIGDLNKAQHTAYELGDKEAVDALNREIYHGLRNQGYIFQTSDLTPHLGALRSEVGLAPFTGSPFISKLGAVVAGMPDKFGAQELMGRFDKAGVKKEEIDYSQIRTFLEGKKSVTKDETLAWLDENYFRVEEEIRWLHRPQGESGQGTAYHGYTLPGANDPQAAYGELLIKLPENLGGEYQSSHWSGVENPLLHVRFSTRPVNGKRYLFIEEIQSDWMQQGGRRGFRRPIQQHPDYGRRRDELYEAQQAYQQAKRNLRINEQGQYTDFEVNYGVNLDDPASVKDLSDELIYGGKAVMEDARYEVGVEELKNAYGEPINEFRLGIVLRGKDGKLLRPETSIHREYGGAPLEDARQFLQQQADEMNRKFVDRPLAELVDAQDKVTVLYRAWRDQSEKQSLMDALSSDVQRGIADAPFKETWDELGFKRMLAWAVDKGYEGIAFTTGAQQVKRYYDLTTDVRRIEVEPGTRVPEPGTYEYDEIYQQALEQSFGSYEHERFIDNWIADTEDVPPEPDYQEIYSDTLDEMYRNDEVSSSDPSELSVDEANALDYETEDRYDAAVEEHRYALESARDRAEEAYAEDFQDNFDIENYLEYFDPYGERGDHQISVWRRDTPQGRPPDGEYTVTDDQLEDYVGDVLAQKIREGETVFEGEDLVVGEGSKEARGLASRYDKKLRSFTQKYLKKYGVEVRAEKLGYHRQTKLYDVFYRPHASTAEVGTGHESLAAAVDAIHTYVQNRNAVREWRIVDANTGAVLNEGGGGEDWQRAYRDRYVLPDPRNVAAGKTAADYRIEPVPELSANDFQIVPRIEDEWVGPEPTLPRIEVRPFHPEGYDRPTAYEVVRINPAGDEQLLETHTAREDAQAAADELQSQLPIPPESARRAYPWGEDVHAAALPPPAEKSWNDFIQYKAGLGETVGRHDMKALEEFSAWHPDEPPIRQFVREGQPIFQRGGALPGEGPYGIKGAIYQDPVYAVRAVVNFTEYGDLTTFVHELFGHFAPRYLSESDYRQLSNWAGGNFDPARGDVDVAAAEKVARGVEQFVLEGHGPTPVKQAFRTLGPIFQEHYSGADLPTLDPKVRSIFDRLFGYQRLKGGKLVGAEDIGEFSVARVPTLPGRPIPPGIEGVHQRVASMMRYILSGGKIIGKGPVDRALMNEYKGLALQSGYFHPNAIKGTSRDALLAIRITTIHKLRGELLKAAGDLPTNRNDIAIKVNPDKTTPRGVQVLLDKMAEIDQRKGGALTAKDMEQIDFDILEEGSRDIFPAMLLDEEGKFGDPGQMVDVRHWAQEAYNRQEPIEGIKWIPHEWLDSSGLTPPPAWKGTLLKTFTSSNKGLIAVDALNDMTKMMVLYLNPAYIPINLTGNLVMNLMQQGVFAPTNLWRSALMHNWLDGWERKMIDNEMGNGLTASIGQLRTGPGELVNAHLGFWINQAVDLIPRRAAWLHEARRAGYRSKEQVRKLIRDADGGDEQAIEEMRLISYRANDAIVDYERMSPLERAVTSRLIFFYPWLKGATRYSMRFALEHPVQAVALLLAAEHAYTYQQQQLGTPPYYESTDIPIGTRAVGFQLGIPGIYDGRQLGDLSQVFGDHKWVKGKYPMVIDARQLFTFTTPLDIYRAGFGLVTGDPNTPALVDNLTPFLGATITTLQGYDSFRHKEVPRSLKTFLGQVADVPQQQRWRELAPVGWGGMSDKERREIQQNAINPRTKEEEWWRLFGSGLAPSPYSYEVAAKRTLADQPTKIRHVVELKMDAHKYGIGPVSDRVVAQLNEYDDLQHEKKSGMSKLEVAKVTAKYYKRHPELQHADDIDSYIRRADSDSKLQGLIDAMNDNLEHRAWSDYWKLRQRVNQAKGKYATTHLTKGS
jgi:hypothetical protein